MDVDELQAFRRERLLALAEAIGGRAELGRALGHKTGAFVYQMLDGRKPVSEKTVLAAEALPGRGGWFAPTPVELDLDAHPDLVSIRKVRLRLQAGVSGFAVEHEDGDGMPIFFRADWLQERGYKPYYLLAVKVKGPSMEPTLYGGDTVVINTSDIEPRDGVVFAVNYEGEAVIKRLVRDGGVWWLASDNPDKRRFPHKECREGACIIVGRVVHKQSEQI